MSIFLFLVSLCFFLFTKSLAYIRIEHISREINSKKNEREFLLFMTWRTNDGLQIYVSVIYRSDISNHELYSTHPPIKLQYPAILHPRFLSHANTWAHPDTPTFITHLYTQAFTCPSKCAFIRLRHRREILWLSASSQIDNRWRIREMKWCVEIVSDEDWQLSDSWKPYG